jgi:hypothetical protein
LSGARARRLGIGATALGAVVLALACVWWWLVFRQIIANAYLSAPGALPCLVGQSIVCRLAQALCTSDHVLGIRRYYAASFWAGAGLLATGLAAWRAARAGFLGSEGGRGWIRM